METKNEESSPKIPFNELVATTVNILEKLEKETGIKCIVSVDENIERITIRQKK